MTFDVQAAADLWWPTMSTARWFQGKGREGRLVGVHPLPWLVPPPSMVRVRSEIATMLYDDGQTENYHLLVAYRDEQEMSVDAEVGMLGVEYVSDAPRDPEAMAAVTAALLTEYTLDHDADTVTVHIAAPLPDGDLTPRWYAGEQSNTNVFLGDVALLKIFRKLEIGPNLDVEITAALREAGVDEVPAVYGWLEASVAGERLDLAALMEQLDDPQDGWKLACDACGANRPFTDDAAALGTALADVHRGLAGGATETPGDEIADRMSERLDAAVAAAPALGEFADGLRQRFDALRGRALPVQRIHGDFHLGQTLRTTDGWRIIDFEGEPLKSMAERRRPDSIWRDVAGMMRSFSYATSAAAVPEAEGPRAWLNAARSAFLDAYSAGGALDADVLAAYEADKAVYEAVYEVRNRPDWISIPLRAVREFATR